MMDNKLINNIQINNEIIDVDSSILKQVEERSPAPDNSLFIVYSIFDFNNNFISQKIETFDGNFSFNDEIEFANFLRDEILDLDEENTTLRNGIYNIRVEIYNDLFGILDNIDNKFIVNEISPDRTEIRLTPFQNNNDFIEIFNRFKNYEKTERTINTTDFDDFIDYVRNYDEVYFNDQIVNTLFRVRPVELTGLEDDFSIHSSSFYLYILSIIRTQIGSANSELSIDEINQRSIDETERLMGQLKINYQSYRGQFSIDLVSGAESLRTGYTDRLNSVTSNSQLTAIVNEFKDEIQRRANFLIREHMETIFNTIGTL